MAKEAKMALLSLQFMKGILNDAHMTLLENDPTPSLNKMMSFIKSYWAITHEETVLAATGSSLQTQIEQLVSMVAVLTTQHKELNEKIELIQEQRSVKKGCYGCWRRTTRRAQSCHECHTYGHMARDCKNNVQLN